MMVGHLMRKSHPRFIEYATGYNCLFFERINCQDPISAA